MIEIRMHQADVNIATTNDGTKAMTFIDPHTGIAVRVFLPPEAADKVADALSSSPIIVAPATALTEQERRP